ncbi:hypothetical protein [Sorangium sp. So ce854]|uniref:hypothetical protein n=1 Tax=Sorangium sp. So ce854 TaxID=3133322 RepID=UPI003F61E3CE
MAGVHIIMGMPPHIIIGIPDDIISQRSLSMSIDVPSGGIILQVISFPALTSGSAGLWPKVRDLGNRQGAKDAKKYQ